MRMCVCCVRVCVRGHACSFACACLRLCKYACVHAPTCVCLRARACVCACGLLGVREWFLLYVYLRECARVYFGLRVRVLCVVCACVCVFTVRFA